MSYKKSGLNFIEDFKRRGMALLCDTAANPARALVVSPAQDVATNTVNEILGTTGGLLFVALSPERVSQFMLSTMSRPRTQTVGAEPASLNMCVSVEAREGVTTGISVADRTATIRCLGESIPNPRKLVKPGHIIPVEVRAGGVLVRSSLPEGALDLVSIAGFSEAALFSDLLDGAGEVMPVLECRKLAERLKAPFIELDQLIRYRLENETLIQRVAEAKLPTVLAGELRSCIYKSTVHSGEHLALIKGKIDPDRPTLTRVQTEFTFSDVFGGSSPASRRQLHQSLRAIGERGSGVLVYLRRPSRGQLKEQVRASESLEREKPAALMREYGLGAQILRDLGVRKIELLTNSKKSLIGIKTFGIEIVSQLPIPLE